VIYVVTNAATDILALLADDLAAGYGVAGARRGTQRDKRY
jgi:hypothetical protein